MTLLSMLASLIACKSPTPAAVAPGDPTACGEPDAPCLLGEVDPDVVDQMKDLSDAVLERLVRGDGVEQVRSWLETQPGVVDVLGEPEDASVAFRVDRGTWSWVQGPGAERPATEGEPRRADQQGRVASEGEETKRARLISPYIDDFGVWDDLPRIRPTFEATPDYGGRVEAHIDDSTANLVNNESWLDWDGLAVAHVSSHGDTLCRRSGACVSIVAIGNELLGWERSRGVFTTVYGERTEYYWLTDLAAIQGDLSGTLVFMSTCRGYRVDDGADAFAAKGAVYLGWSDYVLSTAAAGAAERFYEETLEKGRLSGDAYQALVSAGLTRNVYTDDGVVRDNVLRTTHPGAGEGLRLREVVELRSDSGERLAPASRLAVVGTPDDGQLDQLDVVVGVDGVEPGQEGSWAVEFLLDGVTSETELTLSGAGTQLEPHRWEVRGRVQLPSDVSATFPHVLQARVSLPEGGVSTHTIDVTFGGPRVVLESTLTLNLDGAVAVQEIRAEAPLDRDPQTGVWTGSGPLVYSSYAPFSVPDCTVTSTSTVPGTFHVNQLVMPQGVIEGGAVPEQLRFALNGLQAQFSVTCAGAPFSIQIPDALWVASFFAARQQEGVVDANSQGIVVPPMTAGAGNIAASFTFQSSQLSEGIQIDEVTELRLEAP